MKKQLLLLFIFLFTAISYAQPPEPPVGMRWKLNEKFSDEFNGTKLDETKWYNYHPTWAGRVPGIFLPSQVTVADGYLQLKGEKMKKDTIVTTWNGEKLTYNIACAAVISKSTEASFGYYESRFKAAKTTMSTTFWLSSRKNFTGPKGCNDKYNLELDIQECIGREGNFTGSWFAKGMHSNSHYWYTDCEGKSNDLRADEVKFESSALASDGFSTYGGWWKDEANASFYYNNGAAKDMKFYSQITAKPFDQPMGVNLVSETYPFPWIELPNDTELADDTKNTAYYDWVRAYDLVDVNYKEDNTPKALLINGDLETGDLTGWTGWGGNPLEVSNASPYEGTYAYHIIGAGAPEQVVDLKPNTAYTLTAYCKAVKGSLSLGIKRSSGEGGAIQTVSVTNTSYELKTIKFTTSADTKYKFYLYAPSANDEGYIDNAVLTEDNPLVVVVPETIMFNEKVSFSEKPTAFSSTKNFAFSILYQDNADRELHVGIYNDLNVLVAEKTYPAYAGFGKKNLELIAATNLEVKKNYTAKIYIRPLNSADNTTAYTSDSFTFFIGDDDDNDGIENDKDLCPNTPIGTTVDQNGCPVFQLSNDNFHILISGETCENKKNGKIAITASQPLNYVATLSGIAASKNFTQNTTFDNLAFGEYELCISIPEKQNYKQCFTIKVEKAPALVVSPKVSVDQKNINLSLSGSDEYSITLNNKTYTTTQSDIELPLNFGTNKLEVSTKKECQGVFSKEFIIEQKITIAPNPFSNYLSINLGSNASEKATIKVFTTLGKLVASFEQNSVNGQVQINNLNINTGVYLMSVQTTNNYQQFKIIKE